MSVAIHGIGLCVPRHSVTQDVAAEFAVANCVASGPHKMLARRIYENSGVQSRHSVLLDSSSNGEPARQSYFEPSSDARPFGPSTGERMAAYRANASELALQAAGDAIDRAELQPSDITHVVSVSCSGFSAPGFDVALIDQLPLARSVARTHVGFMGCHGALNGLRVAKAFAKADPAACVLVAAVELCTLHYHYEWTPGRIVSNSLFADGAAAAVVRSSDQTGGMTLVDDFSEIVPECLDAMTWNIGDHGFEMTLSAEVPELLQQQLRPRVQAWLARNGLTIDQVGSWAIHPGGPKILEATIEALGLPEDALETSYEVLSRYGNMSSPTNLFVLEHLRRKNAPGPIVAMGFGPGLAIEAALIG